MYRWQGEMQRDTEVVLIAKTSMARFPSVKDWLVRNHSYECPCVIALPIVSGHEPFLQWLAEQTAPSDED